MEIKVKIEAPELASTLSDIAIALSAIANLSGGTALPSTVETTTENPPAEETELKPSDLKKKKIADEIISLGGTPPEKGSIAKFEGVLLALKANQEEDGEEEESEEAEQEKTEEVVEEETTDQETEDVSLDAVRTLAYATIRKNPDNENKGRKALAGALKTVKAEKVTTCSQKQLNALVPIMEKYLGKKLAEVLAEAE